MKGEKKIYKAPELTVYGNVKEITKTKPPGRPGKQILGGDGESSMGWPS